MLYKDVLNEWIECKKLEIRKSSIQNYLQCINNWIIPSLGNIPIQDITRVDLQNFVTGFAASHKHNTLINFTKPLSQSFKWAEENSYIKENPWNKVKIPKDFSEKEINVFLQEEIHKILSVALGYKKDMILLGYRTGMRIGEILVLKWDDINFHDGFLTVRRTLSGYSNDALGIAEPKTKKSRRRIDLDRVILEMLYNRYKSEEMYVFSKRNGSIYSRQSVNLPKICKSIGIKPRSFHTLRHTHATILLAAGVHPKIVQERLGHSKISTTLDTYSHVIPGMQKAAVDVFNNM